MAKKLLVCALVFVLALGGWLAYYFSDKQVIKRQFARLAVEIGKEGPETPVQIAMKMLKVKNMLAERCLMVIPKRRYSEALEQDLVIRYLIYHRNRYAFLTVTFEDVVVDIPAKGEAVVQTAVHLNRKMVNGEDAAQEVHQLEVALHKGDKKWLLQKVTMPEALVE